MAKKTGKVKNELPFEDSFKFKWFVGGTACVSLEEDGEKYILKFPKHLCKHAPPDTGENWYIDRLKKNVFIAYKDKTDLED